MVTEREIGELQQRVKTLEHRIAGDRQITTLLEVELDELRDTVNALRSRFYGVASSVVVFAGLIAWVLEFNA